jgi:mannosyltransferase OCH1-like enzyme
MNKTLHQVWVQGIDALPPAFAKNRELWRKALPGWTLRIWSDADAAATWNDWTEISPLCSHHAMRADIILARCLRDFGGLTCGTDTVPMNAEPLRTFCETNPTMLVVDFAEPEVSNGLAWSANPGHPFFGCVCNHQLRDRSRLAEKNIPAVTGPGAWWQALRARRWDVQCVSVRTAYSRQWREKQTTNPKAWVNPGYAASWWHAAQK